MLDERDWYNISGTRARSDAIAEMKKFLAQHLKNEHGYPIKEISKELGISQKDVKRYLKK